MKKILLCLALAVFQLSAIVAQDYTSFRKYHSIHPGELWLDTNGRPIQAHGFQVIFHDGAYYWYGENKEFTTINSNVWTFGIRMYRSTDFYNWEDLGLIIPPDTTDYLSPLHYTQSIDRPHIIYCNKTGKWVCWLKSMDEDGFFVIMQADQLTGPYQLVRTLKPEGFGVGDFDLWADPETQKAYVWFERPHWEMICADLTDDFTDVTPNYTEHFVGIVPPLTREAPTHFVYEGRHYMFSSGTTGYIPNESQVCVFDDPHGEYKNLGNPHPRDKYHTSFCSQITDVIKIPGKKSLYVAVADRWRPEMWESEFPMKMFENQKGMWVNHQPPAKDFSTPKIKDKRNMRRFKHEVTVGSTYVFLPITFKNGMPTIQWKPDWKLEDYE